MGQTQNEEFQNKVCIITGGAGSIGMESAKLMYEAGARVMLVDQDRDSLETAKINFIDDDRIMVCEADVSDSA